MDVSSIVQNSNQMFEIVNKAQTETNDVNETIAKLNIAEKTEAQKDAFRGQVIDMVV